MYRGLCYGFLLPQFGQTAACILSLCIHLDLAYAQFLFPNQNEANDSTTTTTNDANNNLAEESNQITTSNLLTYVDPLLGIKLSYPSNLKI
jgi:hypothetical protein